MKQLSNKEWLNKTVFLLEKGQLRPYVAGTCKTVSCRKKDNSFCFPDQDVTSGGCSCPLLTEGLN